MTITMMMMMIAMLPVAVAATLSPSSISIMIMSTYSSPVGILIIIIRPLIKSTKIIRLKSTKVIG